MSDATAQHEAEGDLTDRQRKQLDFLLADFNSVKSEIARRSNLQRAVLAAYAASCAALFGFVAARAPAALPSQVAVLAIWSCSVLVLLFYVRERFQIARLGLLVATQIAPTAAELTGVPIAELLPSETAPAIPNYGTRTRICTVAFWLAAFAILPALLTLLALTHSRTASSTPNATPALDYQGWQLLLLALVAGAAAIGTIVLLILVLKPLPSPVRRH